MKIHDGSRAAATTVAGSRNRSSSEPISAAMEELHQRRNVGSTTLADVKPVSVGRVLKPLRVGDDLLGEMLGDDDA